MIFMKAFKMGKKMFGGGGKKQAPAKAEAQKKPDTLEADTARTTKQLLSPVESPVKGTRKPIRTRMRAGARKAMSRGSSRSGGR
jgi:hypothetical protein